MRTVVWISRSYENAGRELEGEDSKVPGGEKMLVKK